MNAVGLARACADAVVVERDDGPGVSLPVPETDQTASGGIETATLGHSRGVVDPTRQGIAAASPEPDPLPGASPVSIEQAIAAVEGWRGTGMPLFGLHQIAIALADEVGRLRAAAREAYAYLMRLDRHESTDGHRLAEALGIVPERDDYPGKDVDRCQRGADISRNPQQPTIDAIEDRELCERIGTQLEQPGAEGIRFRH